MFITAASFNTSHMLYLKIKKAVSAENFHRILNTICSPDDWMAQAEVVSNC